MEHHKPLRPLHLPDLVLLQTKVDRRLYDTFKAEVRLTTGKTVRWILEDFLKREILRARRPDDPIFMEGIL